ncbi:hypothetical protein KUH14_002815 [Vibrio parahaemolyticus]|nr:hypothetical protein [Vibrio parahaemolyticus]EHR0828010.1 hypothetical protein [Vibrio parahaemolyticus]EHR1159293.1 hypothetical protein [Vibrio parahaemolyticus]EHR5009504.1 hypothetical protein [Vibrio parahaemolyticus]ELB2170745.1 hypothetical protein [Vibrio parahaemolyticus]
MNPVGSNPVNSYAKQPAVVAQNQDNHVDTAAAPLKVEQNKVTLSTEGKALLAALQQIDHESKKVEAENKTMGEKVESFTHGALGMVHPDKIEEEEDGSYSAGQYLSAALTVGGIILALV